MAISPPLEDATRVLFCYAVVSKLKANRLRPLPAELGILLPSQLSRCAKESRKSVQPLESRGTAAKALESVLAKLSHQQGGTFGSTPEVELMRQQDRRLVCRNGKASASANIQC